MWYKKCYNASPFGVANDDRLDEGILWVSFKGRYTSIDTMKWMIR